MKIFTDPQGRGFLRLDDNRQVVSFRVEEAHQRQGVGTALLKQAGPGPLRVELAHPNSPALHFYEKVGFVHDGESATGQLILKRDAALQIKS